MARKRFSKLSRVDPDFEREMRDLAKVRLTSGLAKHNPKNIGTAEMTRLLRRTDGYKKSIEELRKKPRKEDLI